MNKKYIVSYLNCIFKRNISKELYTFLSDKLSNIQFDKLQIVDEATGVDNIFGLSFALYTVDNNKFVIKRFYEVDKNKPAVYCEIAYNSNEVHFDFQKINDKDYKLTIFMQNPLQNDIRDILTHTIVCVVNQKDLEPAPCEYVQFSVPKTLTSDFYRMLLFDKKPNFKLIVRGKEIKKRQ